MGHIDAGFGEQEGVLTLSESVTVEDAGEVRDALINLLNSAGQSTINVAGVTHTDVYIIQLLCSAHMTAGRMGKRMILDTGGCEIPGQVARSTGMMPAGGKCAMFDGACLWAKG